jgi:hypothetical protein
MKLCDPLPCHVNSLYSSTISLNFVIIRCDKIVTEYDHIQECAAKVCKYHSAYSVYSCHLPGLYDTFAQNVVRNELRRR